MIRYIYGIVAIIILCLTIAACGSGDLTFTITNSSNPTATMFAWSVPASRVNGTPLTDADIKQYFFYYGISSGTYSTPLDMGKMTSIDFTDPLITTTLQNLNLKTGDLCYVAITSVDMDNRESDFSNELEIKVQ